MVGMLQSTRSVAIAPLALAVVGATALGGCKLDLASAGCERVTSNELRVVEGSTCKFSYAQGDIAKYVVKVTRPPYYGEATGDGKYLTYVAKKGFNGQDRLTIRVERRGVGHVQWETRVVTVKVGPAA